jgi:hypothetical protein
MSFIIALWLAVLPAVAWASDPLELSGPCAATDGKPSYDPNCYTLQSISVTPDVSYGFVSLADLPKSGSGTPPILEQRRPGLNGEPGAGNIKNDFEWVWRFIKESQPSVNLVKPPFASALPREYAYFTDMENWRGPQTIHYQMVAKNTYGMKVVKVEYTVQYNWGGTYKGKGKYLTNVTVIPNEVQAAWGFTVNMEAQVPVILNFGTEEEPLAGLQVVVLHQIRTVLLDRIEARSYVVKGDGSYQEVLPVQFAGL